MAASTCCAAGLGLALCAIWPALGAAIFGSWVGTAGYCAGAAAAGGAAGAAGAAGFGLAAALPAGGLNRFLKKLIS